MRLLVDRSGLLNELVGRLGQALPSGATELKADFEKNARTVVQGALEKMELVTREEFDLQSALLQRTREKVDRLEELVAQLESQQSGSSTGNDSQ
jgi:BMFP domain-containing protein YqiC